MEPPSHYWKLFEVSMWKTLHDLPYSWHLYQLYRHQFTTSNIFAHPGFTSSGADDIQRLTTQAPHVHLVHGDNSSAGSVQFVLKFGANGQARANSSPVVFHDEVPAHLRLSIFIRASLVQLPLAAYALLSAKTHINNLLEAVVVVQEADEEVAHQTLPPFVHVLRERTGLSIRDDNDDDDNDEPQRQHTLLMADAYCQGDYILLLDAEALFFRPLLRRDLFIFHKPIISFSTWRDQAQQQHIACSTVDNEYFLFPRSAYAEARQSWQADHGRSSWSGLTAVSYIAEYLYKQRPDSLSWRYVGEEQPPPMHSLPQGYASLRPPLLCRGDSRLPLDLQGQQLHLMQRIALGLSLDCDSLHHLLQQQQ